MPGFVSRSGDRAFAYACGRPHGQETLESRSRKSASHC
jgi:hypothetical protein